MITVKDIGMDPHSMDLLRDGKHIGYIQWHGGKEPRIVLIEAFGFLTLSEIEDVTMNTKFHTYLREKENKG